MEIDLAAAASPIEAIRSQVCIIGAGIAGLTLAQRLTRQGIDIILLEAGGHDIEDNGQRLIGDARLDGQKHIGSSEGRFRVFGGSSLRWGGQVLAMSRNAAAEWPTAMGDLSAFSIEAERLLGVDALPYEGAEFLAAVHAALPSILTRLRAVDTRLSKWTPFSRRNLAVTLGRDLIVHSRARVYLHAQVTELSLAPSRTHLEAVIVRNLAGARFRFEAEQFVLAAGTVETSRLLLASRSVAPEGVGNAHDQVGRSFHDHPTLPVAKITGTARGNLLQELRPWVIRGTVHSIKLEASQELRERLALNPILAHIAIDEPEGSGVAVLRELLMASQRRELRRALSAQATRVPAAAGEAVRLVLAAKVQHRRFVSEKAMVKLQFNVAQDIPSKSRITLGSKLDAYGLPQVAVDWHVTANELATFRNYAAHLREQFETIGLDGFVWLPELFVEDAELPRLEDARHAMGGACMGVDPRSSVVDVDLRVHGVANLSIASAAVFPNGSAQLPSLTMMALSLRLAEHLARRVRR